MAKKKMQSNLKNLIFYEYTVTAKLLELLPSIFVNLGKLVTQLLFKIKVSSSSSLSSCNSKPPSS